MAGVGRVCTATMTELRSYVQLALLWDASRDPDALVAEFISAFYSPLAAPYVASRSVLEACTADWDLTVTLIRFLPSSQSLPILTS